MNSRRIDTPAMSDDGEKTKVPLLKKTAPEAKDGVFFNMSAKPQLPEKKAEASGSEEQQNAPATRPDSELPVILYY